MERNKSTFFYLLYKAKEDVTDDEGYEVGEKRVIYGEAVEMKASLLGRVLPLIHSQQPHSSTEIPGILTRAEMMLMNSSGASVV